jgi:hypothetical protein
MLLREPGEACGFTRRGFTDIDDIDDIDDIRSGTR